MTQMDQATRRPERARLARLEASPVAVLRCSRNPGVVRPSMSVQNDLLLEVFGRVAADPGRWDELIDVLPEEGGEVAVAHVLQAQEAASRGDALDGRGIGRWEGLAGWIVLSPRGGVVACNEGGAAAFAPLGEVEIGAPLRWRREANALIAAAALRKARSTATRIVVRFERAGAEGPSFAFACSLTSLPALAGPRLAHDQVELTCLVFPAVEPTSRVWSLLRESFGLTEAETRLAQKLRDGRSLQQASEALGVSVHTARNHLRAIFDKMGVQRQSELVRTLTELGSLDRALQDPVAPPPSAQLGAAPAIGKVVLRDGRRLTYRDYGLAHGAPLLVMHEGLGSSLLPAGTDLQARRLGLRIIAVDRPGFGLSDARPGYSLASVADDVVELADALSLGRTIVSGVLSGAAFAVHVAARLGDRASGVLLSSGRAPGSGMPLGNPFKQMRARLLAHPWIVEPLFAMVRKHRSLPLVRRLILKAASHSPGDRAFIEANPWAFEYLSESAGEALARTAHGPADDLRAFRAGEAAAPQLSCRVMSWHGAEDVLAPAAEFLSYLGDQAAEVRMIEGIGHFMPLKHWGDLLHAAADAHGLGSRQ